MKVVRIYIYEGTEKWVRDTLSRSLPDGRRVFASDILTGSSRNSISAVTLGTLEDSVSLLFEKQEVRDGSCETVGRPVDSSPNSNPNNV